MLTVLTFVLDGHRFGLRAEDVSGAIRAATPTPLPGAPRGVLGVLNVRGVFRAVVELRTRFGLPPSPLRPSDRLLLARAGAQEVALVVDHADTLIEVDEASISPAPAGAVGLDLGSRGGVHGLVRLPDGLVLIYDLGALLSAAESAALTEALRRAAAIDRGLPGQPVG